MDSPDNVESNSGYVFKIAGGTTSWQCFKQAISVSLKKQTEFLACYDVVI